MKAAEGCSRNSASSSVDRRGADSDSVAPRNPDLVGAVLPDRRRGAEDGGQHAGGTFLDDAGEWQRAEFRVSLEVLRGGGSRHDDDVVNQRLVTFQQRVEHGAAVDRAKCLRALESQS